MMDRDFKIILTAMACIAATVFMFALHLLQSHEIDALRELVARKEAIIDEQWSVIKGYQDYVKKHKEICDAVYDR